MKARGSGWTRNKHYGRESTLGTCSPQPVFVNKIDFASYLLER